MNTTIIGIVVFTVITLIIILLSTETFSNRTTETFSNISSKLTFPLASAISNGKINHDLIGNVKKGLMIADNQRITGYIYATLWLTEPDTQLTKQLILDSIKECKKYNCNAIVYNKLLKSIQILKATDFDKSLTDVHATTIFNF